MTTTQQSIQQALSLLKERTWVDLTHSFSADTPRFNAFSPLEKKTLFDYSAGFFAQQFTFAGQYGTHIDAPVHFVEGGRYLNDITLKELVLPLVVIDVSTDVAKNPDFTITVREILSFEEQYGEIDSGSFVALRTDWSKRIDDSEAFNNKDADDVAHTPGWSVEHSVSYLKSDTFAQSVMKPLIRIQVRNFIKIKRSRQSFMCYSKMLIRLNC